MREKAAGAGRTPRQGKRKTVSRRCPRADAPGRGWGAVRPTWAGRGGDGEAGGAPGRPEGRVGPGGSRAPASAGHGAWHPGGREGWAGAPRGPCSPGRLRPPCPRGDPALTFCWTQGTSWPPCQMSAGKETQRLHVTMTVGAAAAGSRPAGAMGPVDLSAGWKRQPSDPTGPCGAARSCPCHRGPSRDSPSRKPGRHPVWSRCRWAAVAPHRTNPSLNRHSHRGASGPDPRATCSARGLSGASLALWGLTARETLGRVEVTGDAALTRCPRGPSTSQVGQALPSFPVGGWSPLCEPGGHSRQTEEQRDPALCPQDGLGRDRKPEGSPGAPPPRAPRRGAPQTRCFPSSHRGNPRLEPVTGPCEPGHRPRGPGRGCHLRRRIAGRGGRALGGHGEAAPRRTRGSAPLLPPPSLAGPPGGW